MAFATLDLMPALLRALTTLHHDSPTPIQAAALPAALAGRDVLGCAQTGTGKTAAFVLPILQRLAKAPPAVGARRAPRALILAPTRELAQQIAESIESYGQNLRLTHGVVIGGANINPQRAMLQRGVDIVVATPGRLIDHLGQRNVSFSALEVLVLDEADRMLDMGFIRDIRRILALLPSRRQTLFFSATLPRDIVQLADQMLDQPHRVQVAPPATLPRRITQSAQQVETADKTARLLVLLDDPQMHQAIVFTRTKWGANKLLRHVQGAGHAAAALHGNKSQNQRQLALEGLRSGRLRVLVATDIAARGIDVAGVSHVINYELPQVAEDYVHRIGRTGRAEAAGTAISLVALEEAPLLRDIERLVGQVLVPGLAARGGHGPVPGRRPFGGGRPGSGRPGGGRPGGGAHAAGRPGGSRPGGGRRRFAGAAR